MHGRGKAPGCVGVGSKGGRKVKREIIGDLEVIEMAEDVGIDEVEPVDRHSNKNESLETFIVRLVKIIYAADRIVGISFQLGLVAGTAAEVFILEGFHAFVVGVGEIAYASQRTIDDREFPRLPVINLPSTRNDGKQQGFGGVVGLESRGNFSVDGIGNNHLGLGLRCGQEEGCEKYQAAKEAGGFERRECP